MKSRWAIAIILLLCLLATIGSGQEASRFQSLGGDFGRKIISTIDANDTQPAANSNNNSSLWSWGSSPKGTMVLDGNLIADPRYSAKRLNVVSNWLGESLIDPYEDAEPAYTYTDAQTGEPVQTFVDPVTGYHYYTYTDASSGKQVYVYFNPQTGEPFYVSFKPVSGQVSNQYGQENKTFALPSIFN